MKMDSSKNEDETKLNLDIDKLKKWKDISKIKKYKIDSTWK